MAITFLRRMYIHLTIETPRFHPSTEEYYPPPSGGDQHSPGDGCDRGRSSYDGFMAGILA
ncbi:MAG: hypothetical protein KG029_03925 [Bacteroidetes bacterium]|nr:hypothetical protein [Bacteroidota bacterium]